VRLPIDTSPLQLLVVSEAERLLKFEEGKPRDGFRDVCAAAADGA